MRFEGKVAVVTGAASGIGRAVAQRLAREGAHVALGDVNLAGLKQTAEAIGEESSMASLDVSDWTSCHDFVAGAIDRFGKIDILCNIAGVLDLAPLAEITAERWARTLTINLNGVAFMTHAAMPHLVAQRGNVVNMASAAGLVGIPYSAAYCASKHAVVGFTKAVALEFANAGVRVNAVCPTGVNTPMLQGGLPQSDAIDWNQMMRGGAWLDQGANCEPEDIADAVAFLASDEARRITGIAFPVDGGQTAN